MVVFLFFQVLAHILFVFIPIDVCLPILNMVNIISANVETCANHVTNYFYILYNLHFHFHYIVSVWQSIHVHQHLYSTNSPYSHQPQRVSTWNLLM